VRRVFASGAAARPIQQEREPAKDKRRNEAREFAVNSVRAQRANHEGDQDPCSFSSPSWNQNTDATEDFKHSNDISSVGRVAPSANRPAHPLAEGPPSFEMPARTNTTASKMANAHTAALGSLITRCSSIDMASRISKHQTIRRAWIQLTKPQFLLSDSHLRII
jgi:hypothetical protein